MSRAVPHYIPHDGGWQDRLVNNQAASPPGPRELRQPNAGNVSSNMVALSENVARTVEYLRYHPVDFLLSTATSMGTFMAVKYFLMATGGAIGLGIVAYPLAIGMVASGLIGMGRASHQEYKERNRRLKELKHSDIPPSAAELADASKINIAGIVENGIQRAMFSGLISGVLGVALGHLATPSVDTAAEAPDSDTPDTRYPYGYLPPMGNEYQAYLDALGQKESGGDYRMYADKGHGAYLGKYQFGEAAMQDLGYYYGDGANDQRWHGMWSGKDGIWSKEDFLNRPDIQEKAIRGYQDRLWAFIVSHNLDDYVGRTYITESGQEATLTKSGILAGAHLVGPGRYEDGEAVAGLAKFLTTGETVIDGNNVPVQRYIEKFGGHPVPFVEDYPHRVLTHALPVDPNANPYISSGYGYRTNPYPGYHWAVDIGNLPYGTPVLSTADGMVVEANYQNSGHGNHVVVQHTDGSKSQYSHLAGISVREGQFIAQQQPLGTVGSTGHSTAPHLHYALHDRNGHHMNPLHYLPSMPWKSAIQQARL